MKKTIAFIVLLLLLISLFIGFYLVKEKERKQKEANEQQEISEKKKEDLIKNIQKQYSQYVKTTKKANLYLLQNEKYQKIGTVKKDMSYQLEKIDKITEENTYFKIKEMDYYLFYQDVEKVDSYTASVQDYQNYIPFNESVVTKTTKLYQGDSLVYDLDTSITAPILVKDNTYRYIAYHNDLYYVKEEDIEKTIQSESSGEIATKMAVLNYHFFFEDGDTKCNEIMCIPRSQFEKEMKYLKDNGYYTVSMKEFEWFLDKKVQLPKKSVLITVDDGAYGTTDVLPSVLEKYKQKASLFLITGTRNPTNYIFPYLELHSHSHDLHNVGVCSGGQGGGIKCLSEEKVLTDLKTSRDLLNGSSAFAYPFYEYNTRAISLLKKAGFTVAFIGGNKKATPGIDKMLVPRYPIVNTTSLNDFIKKIS